MSSVSNETMMPYRWENETKILVEIKQVEERRKQRTLETLGFAIFISLFYTVSVNHSNEAVIHQRVSR